MPDEFLFNVEKWFGSIATQRMSFAEKGVYFVMMLQQWRDKARSLPDDAAGVAELIAVTPDQVAEVHAAWDVVRRKFLTSKHTPLRIYNATIEETRRTQRNKFRVRQEAGRVAGKASSRKRQTRKELPINDSLTTVERSLTTDQRLPTVRIGKERIGEDRSGEDRSTPPNARSRHPMFSGQRLTVFDWMVEDCLRILGSHIDAFDLHAWFFELDAHAVQDGLVIPKRDGGEWLQRQLVAEAQRRGLPLRMATTQAAGKSTTRLAAALANIKASES